MIDRQVPVDVAMSDGDLAPAAMGSSGPTGSVEIPLKGSGDNEVIEIEFDRLPPADDIVHILTEESAQLHLWVTLAVEYYR